MLKYLIMEEYEMLSCVHGYHEYQSLDSGSGQRTLLRNGNAMKSKVSLCYCSKEGWYHSLSFMQDFKVLLFFNTRWKIFTYLIFAVWLNRKTFYHQNFCKIRYVCVVCVYVCVCACTHAPKG